MLADRLIRAHDRAKKFQPNLRDIFKINQGDTKLLLEFVAQFWKEIMQLLMVPDDWAVKAFTKGLSPKRSITSFKLKEILIKFEATTQTDMHNGYEAMTWKDKLHSFLLRPIFFPIRVFLAMLLTKWQQRLKGKIRDNPLFNILAYCRNNDRYQMNE